MELRNLSKTLCRTFIVVVLLALTGCGTPSVKPEQVSAIEKVGVVSLLPTDLVYEKVGVTVFNNERVSRPVGNSLNLAARQGAERALRFSRREVVQLEVDVPVLAKRMRSGAIHFNSPAERIEDVLTTLARDHQLDAIVLIAESFDADNGIRGVRMFLRAGLGEIRFAAARPDVITLVLDPKAKLLAAQGYVAAIAVDRPGSQAWSYRLEENLDVATHEHVSLQMQKAIDASVVRHVSASGL